MAKKGHNEHIETLKKLIVEKTAEISRLDGERSEAGDGITAIYAAMEAQGLPKKAYKAVLGYMKLDENDRRAYDTAYKLIREALGAPIQADFFDLLQPKEGEEPEE